MGWSLRKSLRLLPGIKVNLSKDGPRLSVGVPGVRASVDMKGKGRIYGGIGPLRYQHSVDVAEQIVSNTGIGQALKGLAGRLLKR